MDETTPAPDVGVVAVEGEVGSNNHEGAVGATAKVIDLTDSPPLGVAVRPRDLHYEDCSGSATRQNAGPEEEDSSLDASVLLRDLGAPSWSVFRRMTDSDYSVDQDRDAPLGVDAKTSSFNNTGQQRRSEVVSHTSDPSANLMSNVETFQNDDEARSHNRESSVSNLSPMKDDGISRQDSTMPSMDEDGKDEIEESPSNNSKLAAIEDSQTDSAEEGANEDSGETKMKRSMERSKREWEESARPSTTRDQTQFEESCPRDDLGKPARKRVIKEKSPENDSGQEWPPKKRTRTPTSEASSSRDRLNACSKASSSPSPSGARKGPEKQREPGTEIGSRVYAEFSNKQWYWAIITDIKRKRGSHFDQYSLLFDDGDFLPFVSRSKFITLSAYGVIYQTRPPPVPKAHRKHLKTQAVGDTSQEATMTLEELLQCSCGECTNCRKDDCGRCASCVANPTNQVCLQKICCEVPVGRKAQPIPRSLGFPEGWKFVIDPDAENCHPERAPMPCFVGLKLLPPSSFAYYSVEGAQRSRGQRLNDVSAKDFYAHLGATSAQHKATKTTELPDSIKSHQTSLSPEDLLNYACGTCVNCGKDDCGKCASCRGNLSNSYRKVCLQKMCCLLPVNCKAQPMPPSSGFPVGWKFVIDPTMIGYRKEYAQRAQRIVAVDGLRIMPPGNCTDYYSAEAAKGRCRVLLADTSPEEFYRYIGATSESIGEKGSFKPGGEGRACGTCENCLKNACGACATCRSSSRGVSSRCFHKMCLELPVESKAERAVGFPEGWRFYFAKAKAAAWTKKYRAIPVLWILSPGGKFYRSAEAAVGGNSLRGGAEIARKFYEHVGLRDAAVADPQMSDCQLARKEWTLCKTRVVGSRVFCRVQSDEFWGFIEQKFQVGKNKFQFSVRLEDNDRVVEGIKDSCVMSEYRYMKKTGRKPPPPPSLEESVDYDGEEDSREGTAREPAVDSFSCNEIRTTTDNFLTGRMVRFDWYDSSRQRKVVYGRITQCEYNVETKDVITCDVRYSNTSREFANRAKNGCGSFVPESRKIRTEMAIGGCVRFEEESQLEIARLSDYLETPFHWTWISPESRLETVAVGDNGVQLPHLELVCRGFKLSFTVKPSKIPNAGNGVFLSCMPISYSDDEDFDDEGQKQFELNAGELLDLGVYAPLRIEDKKVESAFYVKNFIHSFSCEEWAFNAGDMHSQLDITDDSTGELHDIAKSRIHAYVNESNVNEDITIAAEHDPEGDVHYLLGHSTASQGKFVLPADGTEIEVYVNYGEGYEKVRVRKGYSFLSEEEMAELLKALADEDVSDVMEIDNFGEADLDGAVRYLWGVFSSGDHSNFMDADASIMKRALVCAAVLQRRAQHLLLERSENDEELSSTVSMQKVLKVSRCLVSQLLKMTIDEHDELKVLQKHKRFDELLKRILEREFSAEQLSKLREQSDMME